MQNQNPTGSFFTVSFQNQIVCFKHLIKPHMQLVALKTWKKSEEDTMCDHSAPESMKKLKYHLHFKGERGGTSGSSKQPPQA